MSFEKLTAEQLIQRLEAYSHKELQIHHTYVPAHKDFNGSNHDKLQEGMRNYHVNTKGWQDIAQHVTLFPDGTFLTGRDFGKSPAGISGYNTGAFMVEMVGNFDKDADRLEGAQLEAILKLAKYFDDKGRYIRFHRENAAKSCPGTGINKDDFIAAVKSYGAKPKPAPAQPSEAVSSWAKDAHAWAVAEGISDGTRPKDGVTREELWTMLYRLSKK